MNIISQLVLKAIPAIRPMYFQSAVADEHRFGLSAGQHHLFSDLRRFAAQLKQGCATSISLCAGLLVWRAPANYYEKLRRHGLRAADAQCIAELVELAHRLFAQGNQTAACQVKVAIHSQLEFLYAMQRVRSSRSAWVWRFGF